jgi:hypothetical protein
MKRGNSALKPDLVLGPLGLARYQTQFAVRSERSRSGAVLKLR